MNTDEIFKEIYRKEKDNIDRWAHINVPYVPTTASSPSLCIELSDEETFNNDEKITY